MSTDPREPLVGLAREAARLMAAGHHPVWTLLGLAEAAFSRGQDAGRHPGSCDRCQLRGDAVHIDIEYPRNDTALVREIVVGLVDVRAADDIRITYDFERDGWAIWQATKFEWADDDPNIGDPCWVESAFVRAWAREKSSQEPRSGPGEAPDGEKRADAEENLANARDFRVGRAEVEQQPDDHHQDGNEGQHG